jgi:hypothetical protein
MPVYQMIYFAVLNAQMSRRIELIYYGLRRYFQLISRYFWLPSRDTQLIMFLVIVPRIGIGLILRLFIKPIRTCFLLVKPLCAVDELPMSTRHFLTPDECKQWNTKARRLK